MTTTSHSKFYSFGKWAIKKQNLPLCFSYVFQLPKRKKYITITTKTTTIAILMIMILTATMIMT